MLTPESTAEENIDTNKIYKTYKIDFENKRIVGYVDGYDAIYQYVKKTIMTERFTYEIYSSDIGVETNSYIGKDYDYIVSAIKSSFKDAISLDERIIYVKDINIEKQGIDTMLIKMIVETTEGEMEIAEEVKI